MRYLHAVMTTVLLGLLFVGCGRSLEKYGEVPDASAQKTPISAILFSPNEYGGKDVVIEGTISAECPTGGWIHVEDTSGHRIYVEFHGAEFAPIPQRAGRGVVVKGTVYVSEGGSKEVQLLGKGILIQ
jgi:hypothetical protein